MNNDPVSLAPMPHDYADWLVDTKGFSPRNLKYMRTFAEAWPDPAIVQEMLAQFPLPNRLLDNCRGDTILCF